MDNDVTRTTDDVTDRRLDLLVGLVVIVGLLAIAFSINEVLRRGPGPGIDQLVLLTLCATANAFAFRIRVRADSHRFSVMSSVILVAAMVQPVEWVTLCAAAGSLISNASRRLSPKKTSFNGAKDALGSGTAALVVHMVDPAHLEFGRSVLAMLLAAVAYAVVDEGLFFPVVALATRTSLRQRFLEHWDVRLFSRFGAFGLAVAASSLVARERWLLIMMPLLLYIGHLYLANRVRSKEERDAWQRLARTTDELNSVDLPTVLHTAVARAAELFSADEVEIAIEPLNNGSARIVRGGTDGITFDGSPADAPRARSMVIPAALESHDGGTDVGELRLRFRGQVKLSEREGYTLRTFAAALCTAIRNASAFAETQRLGAEHALAASLDPLTGMANRRRLFEYGAEVLTRRAPVGTTALLLVDLNHFKEVNDTLGHNSGDKVLIEMARRLAGAADTEDLAARLGGDEFAILFVGLPAPAVAIHRAINVLNILGAPIEQDGMRLSIEASGGVATAASTDSVAELLRRADVAMYQAKRTSQRVCAYDRTRDTADVAALALGGDLARALAEDQFVLNYQPIVDIATGEVIAAEALARWSHPDLGDLRPGRFLDAIERSGQLHAFAEVVLDQALVAVASWADAGFAIPVAVNVSPRSLLDQSFPDVVKAHLEARGVPAEMLILELTETLTLSQLQVVDEVLGALRDSGVTLALDDFGTGYSSLATLARVPVQELKIDRSFVSAMDSPTEAAVVRSTIELARSLDLLVVAEGVESEEQRKQLWDLSCPAGQGHLFGRPMAADCLLATLRRGFGGRPGVLVAPLHEGGSVVRIPKPRRGRTLNTRQERSG